MTSSVDLLANNGTVGGGEVMMVALGCAARDAGVQVRVVAPSEPAGAAALARASDLDVLEVPAGDRGEYLRGLARHRRWLDGDLWWCNGLVPALATAGTRHRRVVHLHQEPARMQRRVWAIARVGVEAIFVPSASMASRVPGSVVLENWTDDLEPLEAPEPEADGTARIGFIGRFAPIKGLDVLAGAVQRLDRTHPRPVRLVLAGDGRFVTAENTARVEVELSQVRAVERLGWVSRERFFSSVDVVVAPSVWAEPFGLVAAESMAFGRPVVVSDAGALGDVVGPDHPWVARAGDVVDTARSIGQFLDTDDGTRARWCARARARWESRYSPRAGRARVADALCDLGLVDRYDSAHDPVPSER